MSSYIPQNPKDLLLKFAPEIYSPYKFNNISLDFKSQEAEYSTKYLSASVFVHDIYTNYTYTYLKYCPTYVIGYGRYGIQILKGHCIYGGIRDISAFVKSVKGKEIQVDLPVTLIVKTHDVGIEDLPAFIAGYSITNITGFISGCMPRDLNAKVKIWQTTYEDLQVYLRGLQISDLNAQIRSLFTYNLPSYIFSIQPSNLSAYLKVWPQKDLTSNLHGWSYKDLSASMYFLQYNDLFASITGAYLWDNLVAFIKGWGKNVNKDLQGLVTGLTFKELPTSIVATYLSSLSAYVFPVVPKNLLASLWGFDTRNLVGIINGLSNFIDLNGYIFASGKFENLLANIVPIQATDIMRNLPGYIYSWYKKDLSIYIRAVPSVNLSAYIKPLCFSRDLNVTIFPKVIRLTNIIPVITMEAKDLSSVINACFNSSFRNLIASMVTKMPVVPSNIGASITGLAYYRFNKDISATIGKSNDFVAVDKIPMSLFITGTDTVLAFDKIPIFSKANKIMYYDKITFNSIFNKKCSNLYGSIFGEYTHKNLNAYLVATYPKNIKFDSPKSKENVYFKLSNDNISEFYETVEFSFKEIVFDYFFVSGEGEVYRTDPVEKWLANMASFIPKNSKLNIKRRLHKEKVFYDLRRFSTIDEAVRSLMIYVTSYPKSNLPAFINPRGTFKNLSANLFIV